MIEMPFKRIGKASDGAAAKTVQNISFKLQIIPPNLRMRSYYNTEILLLWYHVSIPACAGCCTSVSRPQTDGLVVQFNQT